VSETRTQAIYELARRIDERASHTTDHALRVAVTGITASGKSTLATELVGQIERLGRPCVRLPVDGFHNPRSVRYRLGRDSAEGYYRDAYNYDVLLSRVLVPLGANGDGYYVDRVFDLDTDTPVELAPKKAVAGSVLILDASFLLRPEIREYFDYRVFVQTSFDEARARGVKRDAKALGSASEAERLYRQRYHAAQRIYFKEAKPLRFADVIFVNEDLEAPVFFIRPEATEPVALKRT
jgi:uridine kinase